MVKGSGIFGIISLALAVLFFLLWLDISNENSILIEDYNNLEYRINNPLIDGEAECIKDYNNLIDNCNADLKDYLLVNDCWERGTVKCYDKELFCYETPK
ncbi:MAG: hypothetical protein IH845_03845 [Nanoarchaeota archaeon]|nr:hypothetical protein [Nanoarchaeota archaeon]